MFGRRDKRNQLKRSMAIFYVNVPMGGLIVQYMIKLSDDVYNTEYLRRIAYRIGEKTGYTF